MNVNGWIIIPREVWERVKGVVGDYVLLTREYGKCVDVQVENLPKEHLDTLCTVPGVVHGCK